MPENPGIKPLEKTYASENKELVFKKLGKRKITGGFRTVQEARNAVAKDLFRSRHNPIFKHLREIIKKEKEKALIDPLTQLYNRRHLGYLVENPAGIGELQREFEEAFRSEHDLSVLMIDIDNFKEYNDTYSHILGDEVLIKIAKTIKKTIRGTDIPFRYGGEEFLILAPETDIDGAKELAKRINEEIAKISGLHRKITVSIGAASYHNSEKYREQVFPNKVGNKDDLVTKADDALYYSKLKGKDRATQANELTNEQYEEITKFRRKNKE